MIRIRGLPITDENAADLARRLRAHSDASDDVAGRIERAVLAGIGIIATDRLQARVLLAVLEERADDPRLAEVRQSLASFAES